MIQSPFHDKVLIKLEQIEKQTHSEGGLLLPDSHLKDKATQTGTVIAVGPGLYTQTGALIPMSAKIGQKVLLPAFGEYTEITIEQESYLIVRDSDLLMPL